jgi:Gpi18-like mannosyltransferase
MTDVTAVENRGRRTGAGAGAVLIAAGLVCGIGLRLAALPYATPDTAQYLLPWYDHAHAHGVAALREAFTNYTPAYSYLLLIATAFHGLAEPLALIKAISFAFELGCALVTYRLVALAHPGTLRPAIGLVAVWLAQSVLYNGALWGQADSLWAFFVLLSVHATCRGRPAWAILWFAVAFAIKAQAVFLAPFILVSVLRREVHWLWLAAVPAVYALFALPTLLMGRPMADVAAIYLQQAGTYRSLSLSAANLYLFVPDALYAEAVIAGLAAAAAAGLFYAIRLAGRARRFTVAQQLLAACLIVLLMPFLLPKMHDRYFYAFEVLAVALALVDPRFLIVAGAAQANALFSYFDFDGRSGLGLPIAAVSNLLLAIHLGRSLGCAIRGEDRGGQAVAPLRDKRFWLYAAAATALAALLGSGKDLAPFGAPFAAALAVYAAGALILISQLYRATIGAGAGPATSEGEASRA